MSDFACASDRRPTDAGGARFDNDDDAFADAWQKYSQELFQRCLAWMGGHRADAEEAFARAAILIYRKFPEHYRQLADPRAWLLRLTHNACMDLHREKSRRREVDLDPDVLPAQVITPSFASTPVRDPERSYLHKELEEFLLSSIDDLTPRLRDTILHHLALAGSREVADRLAITEVNVRKRMQEARAILKHRLSDYRSGSAELILRPINGQRKPPTARDVTGRWRVRALRPVEIRLPSKIETEDVLWLSYPPKRASKRRQSALERYILEHPSGWKKRHELGRYLVEVGKLEEAIPHLEQVVRRQPRQLEPWLELAACHRLLERPAQVVTVYERALAAIPGSSAPEILRGLLERCWGRQAIAEQAFDSAREAAPRSSLPLLALAELRLATGRPAEAVDALDAALAVDAGDAAALTLGHRALGLAGRSAAARRRAARALDIDGSNLPALVRWLAARCRATGGRFVPGTLEQKRLAKLRRLAPARADACRTLALFDACRGDLAAAEHLFATLVRERPRLRQGWVEYARFLDACNYGKRAVTAIDQARALQPRDRGLELLACRLFARAGLDRRVERHVTALLERFGEAWDVAATAAWALSFLGLKPARALRLSRAAIERQPRLPAAWIEHGRVLASWNQLREAEQALETGRRLLPQPEDAALATPAALDLAAIHRRLGHPETCRLWALRALVSATAHRSVDPVLTWVWRRRGAEQLGTAAPAAVRASESPTPAMLPAAVRELEQAMESRSQLSEEPWWR